MVVVGDASRNHTIKAATVGHVEDDDGIGVGEADIERAGVIAVHNPFRLGDDGVLAGNLGVTIDGLPVWLPEELVKVGNWDGEGVTNVAGQG